jgi:hypothetical protein
MAAKVSKIFLEAPALAGKASLGDFMSMSRTDYLIRTFGFRSGIRGFLGGAFGAATAKPQEAFNTYKGFNFEGKSLLDPMPVSFNCIADLCDIGRGYLMTDPFYNSTIYLAGQPRSVEQLIDIVNDPNVDKKAKSIITKQLEKHWENFGSKAEFKKYIHDRRKKGHHRRFDPKWKTILNNKRPDKRIDYIKQGGDQAVRDYNFGTMYN